MNDEINLKITENEFNIILKSVECYLRMHMGDIRSLNDIFVHQEHIYSDKLKADQITHLLGQIQEKITGGPYSLHGVFSEKIGVYGKNIFNLLQKLKYLE